MKKALIDQMLLGFIAVFSIIIFVATVNDDKVIKNKYYQLEDIATESINALAQEYFKNMEGDLTGPVSTVMDAICQAEDITNDLINASDLGNELNSLGKISYKWYDEGTYDASTDSYIGGADGRPDYITATIEDYEKETFWYKFIGKKSFILPRFTRAVDLNKFTFNVDVDFRGVINAGYYNMVGTYTLDSNGCPQNPELILVNKDEWASKIGDTIKNIEMPQTRMFFISDGYRRFDMFSGRTEEDIKENTTIQFNNKGSTDCTNGSSFPDVVFSRAGFTQEHSGQNHSSLTSKANVYFQDNYLNFDRPQPADTETEHMREIAEKDWGAFIAYMEPSDKWNDYPEAQAYYDSLTETEKSFNGKKLESLAGDIDGWDAFVSDRGLSPDYDPTGKYVYISEDLAITSDPSNSSDKHDWWKSDKDFTDMSFSMLKIFVPEPIDSNLISNDYKITTTCN